MWSAPAFLLLVHTAAVAAAPSPSVSTAAACKSSLYPKLCRAILAPLRPPSNPYEYGRFSVKQALKRARRTTKLLNHYLARGGSRAMLAGGGALEDCRLLNDLNLDYLQAVEAELGPGELVLTPAGVNRVRALMSALVTNQQTCFDGLEASRTFPELRGAFSAETQLYGVSLELVSAALDRVIVTRFEPESLGGERAKNQKRVLSMDNLDFRAWTPVLWARRRMLASLYELVSVGPTAGSPWQEKTTCLFAVMSENGRSIRQTWLSRPRAGPRDPSLTGYSRNQRS